MFRFIPAFLLIGAAPLRADDPPASIAPFFNPPKDANQWREKYRSPLKFDDGQEVKTPDDWKRRADEIRKTWHDLMGPWPKLIDKPKLERGEATKKEGFTQYPIKLETAPDRIVDDAFLLVPEGKGPFPAVIVVFYEAKTGIGEGKKSHRDFALQLAKRGFVALSLGGDPNTYYPTKEKCTIQPLSFHAYEAANACNALANLPEVDAKRIGIVGHSYGGKWAMFASCLYDKFAAAAWSDGGIVFDESRGNVNFWEPWYLGFEKGVTRKPGIPKDDNPRTGPYKLMRERGRDLHELHALMAPRPFLVSGGSEDPPERWGALMSTVEVNKLLGQNRGVAMTNRKNHDPNEESNAQLYAFMEWALRK